MINEEDVIIISNSIDPLITATELGYIVDKNLIVELFIEGVELDEEKFTTMNIHLSPEEAESSDVARIIREKITELYGDDRYELIAISSKYRDPSKRLHKTPGYKSKRLHLPKYMKRIIQGIGISECTSFDEIRNFKLGDEDE